jgi:hypothetical protein
MKVTFQFENTTHANQTIAQSSWQSKLVETSENRLVFSLLANEIAPLNEFMVSNNMGVTSILPLRSLEDYFLSLTD